ncbi:MAG: hypothetical protein JWP82_1553, partial [Humibacillus sp.]|nr:hypothetical protein [Humibacillus sp.]
PMTTTRPGSPPAPSTTPSSVRPCGTVAGVADPADLETRFSALVRSGDLDGLVGLYAADAVVSLPLGREAAGHDAIRAAFADALEAGVGWGEPASVRVIVTGALALTSSADRDGVVRTQVARREADGWWVWVRDGSHLRETASVAVVASSSAAGATDHLAGAA